MESESESLRPQKDNWKIDGRAPEREAIRGATYVSELNQAKLSKSVDNLSSDFVGNIQLDHTHVRRAERSIACGSHYGGGDVLLLQLRTAKQAEAVVSDLSQQVQEAWHRALTIAAWLSSAAQDETGQWDFVKSLPL